MADSLEEVVYTFLTSDASFMADFDSVHWMDTGGASPDYPFIVYWQVDDAGTKTWISEDDQGEARIQFDLWDSDKIRGARLRTALRQKVESLNETIGGYTVYTSGFNETTVQRDEKTDPFHFVVDGIVKWKS